MPKSASAQTACSRLEPEPKFGARDQDARLVEGRDVRARSRSPAASTVAPLVKQMLAQARPCREAAGSAPGRSRRCRCRPRAGAPRRRSTRGELLHVIGIPSARTSTRWPAIAAAAAMAGLIRWVRPPLTLPSLEIAVRGRGATLARLEPVVVHGHAHRAAGIAPFEAGVEEDAVEPLRLGLHAHARPSPARRSPRRRARLGCPATTDAATRRSSMRPFVQEPMKTRSMAMSAKRRAGRQAHVSEAALHLGAADRVLLRCAGSGTRPVIGAVSPGLVPQETCGDSAETSSSTSRSNARVGIGCAGSRQ